jgi:hypothetical protein
MVIVVAFSVQYPIRIYHFYFSRKLRIILFCSHEDQLHVVFLGTLAYLEPSKICQCYREQLIQS